jgi:hypothetical protein
MDQVPISVGLSQTLIGGACHNEQRDSSLPEPVQVSVKLVILHVFSPETNNFVFIFSLHRYIISKIQSMIYGQMHGYSELYIKGAYAYDIHTLDSKELYKALRTRTGTCEGTSL